MENTRHADLPQDLAEPHMKTGMNLLLWTGHVTEEHYGVMKDIKNAGFDGVEIPVFDTSVDHYKKVRKELDNRPPSFI
jgi:D-psicose/D-tagatose/L-ribulose 3-epimerase